MVFLLGQDVHVQLSPQWHSSPAAQQACKDEDDIPYGATSNQQQNAAYHARQAPEAEQAAMLHKAHVMIEPQETLSHVQVIDST